MSIEEVVTAFAEAVFDTDREKALRVIRDAVANGLTPEEAVFEVVLPVIEGRHKLLCDVEMNLAQHFMTSQIASEVTEEMIPRFKSAPESMGRIVIGTAYGDLHTLGKRIVMGCLKACMVEAIDLGVNVSAERFVEEAVARHAQVIGISAMMVHTARSENGCWRVRKLLKESGLEKQIKIIVGGAPFRFDPNLYRIVQADAWAENGVAAAKTIVELIKEAKQ